MTSDFTYNGGEIIKVGLDENFNLTSFPSNASFCSYPVITLNSNVVIKDYSNCADGSKRGSMNCPYELMENS